jgi:hypothetical protein
MRAKEFINQYKAKSGQMSAMGSNQHDPNEAKRAKAQQEVEELNSDINESEINKDTNRDTANIHWF